MGKSKSPWYSDVKKAVYRSMSGKEAATTPESIAVAEAIKKAREDERERPHGEKRLQLFELVYGHGIAFPGAAMRVYVSEATASSWTREFIYTVGKYLGYT